MKFLLIEIFLLFGTFIYVKSECCATYIIEYAVPEGVKTCNESIPGGESKTGVDNDGVVGDILSKIDRRKPPCWVNVCYDGHNHPGSYCGHGSCNVFGCDCAGGCIRGNPDKHPEDPYQNFMDNYSQHVKKARLRGEIENWLP